MPQTGPRTTNGKQKASRNALKHGLLSPSPVVPTIEEEADWRRHLQGVMDHYMPDGYMESVLVERIASLLWRLRRAVRHETEMIFVRLSEMPEDMAMANNYARAIGMPESKTAITDDRIADQISRRLLPHDDKLNLIMRYEAHLHRQLLQTLHELEAMQARRRGQSTPLARLDITGAPGV